MFNVTGSEVVILLLLALVVLGPEKLPDAIRRFGKVYGELRKMSQGFQTELRDALDEPMRELRSTADMARRAIEEPVEEISGSAKGIGQAATDAFAAATKFSAAPVQGGGNARKQPPPESADKMAAATPTAATPTAATPTDGAPVDGIPANRTLADGLPAESPPPRRRRADRRAGRRADRRAGRRAACRIGRAQRERRAAVGVAGVGRMARGGGRTDG